LTVHGEGAPDRHLASRLVGTSHRGESQHAEHRIENPPARTAAQIAARATHHPYDERKEHDGPEPSDPILDDGAGPDEHAHAKDGHQAGRYRRPVLRLIGPSRGESRQQRPTEREPEKYDSTDHVLLGSRERERDENDRR
jgi:hypothetical protein